MTKKLFRFSLTWGWMVVSAATGWVQCAPGGETKQDYWIYVGTFTRAESKGIYTSRFSTSSGKLGAPALAAETPNPAFLAADSRGRFLYAVNEGNRFQGKEGGGVSSFSIDPKTGQLTALNAVSSRGMGPCHLSLDKNGKWLLAANYGSGSVAVFPIEPDGRLGEATAFVQHAGSSVNPERQKGPHAHWIDFFPGNQFVLAMDLGLDKLILYRFLQAKGSLVPNDPPDALSPPGSGPRHFAFHPQGNFGYAINELANTMVTYAVDSKKGTLQQLQVISTLPEGFSGKSYTAEIAVHPSGKFVYGSNRGHDSIAVFAVDQAKGTLTLIETISTQGQNPRNFSLDPTGTYLLAANQNSNNLALFRIDPSSGRLQFTGETLPVASPVCVQFVPAP